MKFGSRKEEGQDDQSRYLGLSGSETKRVESYAASVKETIAEGERELIWLSPKRGKLMRSQSMSAIMEK